MQKHKNTLALVLILPAALYMLIIIIYPFLLLIWFSFTNRKIGGVGEWLGINNFIYILFSDIGFKVIINTFRYAGISIFGSLIIGLLVSSFLFQLKKRWGIIDTIIVLPWAIPPTVTALVWLWMFYDISGVVNWILIRFGIISLPISWLGISSYAKLATIIPNIWRLSPFFIICLLAARLRLDVEPYNAAKIDGAGPISQFCFITLPGIFRTILIISAFGLLWSSTEFALIYILTRGGPANSTHLLGTFAYDIALRGGFELGLGSACALLLVPISTILAFSVWKLGSWNKG